MPGVPWDQVRQVALVAQEALEAVGLVGWPKTSGSRGIHINVRIEPRWTYGEVRRAALALARDVEERAPQIATSKWWKEERHGVFLDYNQNAKDRTVASAYSVRPLPDARVSMPLRWDEVADVRAEDFTIATVPALYQSAATRTRESTTAVGSLDGLLELSARSTRPRAWAMRRGRRTTRSRPVSRRGSSPRRSAAPTPSTRAAARTAARHPRSRAERAAAVAAGDPNAGLPTEWEGTRPTPTGRRKSTIPVIEISRAAKKAGGARGPGALEGAPSGGRGAPRAADVLVDGMRGRSSLWYRVRVNLIHVPEADRPAQEPLDPDYDPWAGYEWPDRAGQLERAPRKKASVSESPDEAT